MSSENDAVKRLSDLIKASAPSITRSQTGLSITQDWSTYEIPFSTEGKTVSKSTLMKS